MSSIDERIVAMRFDNGQFEKGVKQSMRTLQELREATNLDDVAASMGDVSKSINQNLQFQSPTKSAGIFSKALTNLGKVAKTTFNAATFPLQALGRSLQSLGKYTRAVLGIDIASQLVHTGEQVIRAFTIDPLKTGWNEYELKMDSIKTIMTGTVKTYTDAMTKKDPQFLYEEEKHLDYVKQGLEELNKYADDTVYSFQDMTTNIGKFTNAGVDFETAVDAIKGVANAAAHAGQGATQASMAMYNISQSLGMGYLGMMDWRSIENANMATLTFKQTLIDMGVALGQLKKDEKSGKLYTINEKGVVDTSMEVTAENLRETLSKKWVNKEVLLNALRVYSGEFSEEELRGLKNLTEEEKAQLRKIGEEAALAATQVRTFTKMWDALKEAAQSGWAISWELVFGDLNEATEFWTSLNDRFGALLDRQAKSREAILRAWRGQRQQYNYTTGEIEWISDSRLEDGRKILIDALNEMLDTIGEVGRGISEAWTSIFGTITGQNLLDATKKLKAFTKAFSDWLGKGNDKSSRISKLTTGLKGIFSVLKGAGNTVKGAITTISQTLHLDKLLDAGISVFGKAGEWLGSLGTSISGIWESIGQTEIMQKLSGFFDGLWESVSKFFTETNAETGSTGFVDWLHNTATNLETIWLNFQQTDFYKNASKIWDRIIGYFSPKTILGKRGNEWTADSDFVSNIKNAFNSVKDFFTDVQSWDIWTTIGSFFDPIIDTIQNFFAPKTTKQMVKLPKDALKIANAVIGDASYVPITKTEDAPFVAWIKKAFVDLEAFFQKDNLMKMFEDAKAGIESVISTIVNFFSPKTIPGKMGNAWAEDSPFVATIKEAFNQIREFFSSDNLEDGESMFGHIFNTAKESFLTKWESFKTWASEIGTEIGAWFEGDTWNSVIGIFTNIGSSDSAESKAEGKENGENDFISNAKTAFMEKWESFKTWAEGIYESIKGWFEGETWTSISKFFTEIGTTLSSIFGSKKDKSGEQLDNEAGFFERIMDSVGNLASKAASLDIWDSLSELFSSIGDMMSSAAEAVKSSKLGTTAKGILKLLFESVEDVFIALHDLLDFFIDPEPVFELGYKGRWGVVMEERVNLLKVVVASVGAIVGSVVTGATSLAVSTAASAIKQFGNIFKSLALFVGSLAVFSALLSIIPQDVRNFVTGTLIIVGAITTIVAAILTFGNIMKGVKAEMPTIKGVAGSWVSEFFKDLLGDVIKWVGIIFLFKEGLPPLINAMKGLDINAGQILALFGGVTVLVAAISGLSILMSKVKMNPVSALVGGGSIAAGLLGAILPLLLAIGVIGAAAKNDLTAGIMDAVLDGIDWIGKMIKRFNEAVTGKTLSNEELVASLTNLAEPIIGLGAVGSAVNVDGILKLEQAMIIIKRIMDIKMNDASWLSQFFAKELTITQALGKMKELATMMREFNAELTGVDFSNSLTALKAFESLGNIVTSMAYIRKNYNNLDNLIQDIMDVFTDQDNAGFWDGLETFMTSLGSAINMGLIESAEKIDANPIVAAIVKSLRAGSPQIQQAIEDAVLNNGNKNKTANGASEAAANAAATVAKETKNAWEQTQSLLFSKLQSNGTTLLQNGWFADFDTLFGQLFGPEGAVGALAGGSLINYLIGDNANLLPFNLGQALGDLFNVDLSHMLPEGMTLDGVLGILASGDSEKIGELMGTYFGIDLTGLNFDDLQNTTVKDLSGLFGMVEGYEGSAIQKFFSENDPNATFGDLLTKYMPEGFDANSLDWTDPAALIATFLGDNFGDVSTELNKILPGGLGSLIDVDAWTKWLSIDPEKLDTSTLQSTVQSIIPALMTAVVNGINEGLKSIPTLDIHFLDQMWAYLGIDSAEIKFTDLRSNVTTIVAQIVPEVTAGISDGLNQGMAGMDVMAPVYDWIGIDRSKIDTSSLKSSIATIMPGVIDEVKAGITEGLKDEPILNMLLNRMLNNNGAAPKLSVSPVLDDTGLESNALLALQNGSISLNGNVSIDPLSLGSVVDAINSQGRSISSAISNLGSKMDSVASAVRGMKMVLDIGVVAGAVDDYIGNQSTLNGRTGTGRNTHGPVMNNTQQYNNYVRR